MVITIYQHDKKAMHATTDNRHTYFSDVAQYQFNYTCFLHIIIQQIKRTKTTHILNYYPLNQVKIEVIFLSQPSYYKHETHWTALLSSTLTIKSSDHGGIVFVAITGMYWKYNDRTVLSLEDFSRPLQNILLYCARPPPLGKLYPNA